MTRSNLLLTKLETIGLKKNCPLEVNLSTSVYPVKLAHVLQSVLGTRDQLTIQSNGLGQKETLLSKIASPHTDDLTETKCYHHSRKENVILLTSSVYEQESGERPRLGLVGDVEIVEALAGLPVGFGVSDEADHGAAVLGDTEVANGALVGALEVIRHCHLEAVLLHHEPPVAAAQQERCPHQKPQHRAGGSEPHAPIHCRTLQLGKNSWVLD